MSTKTPTTSAVTAYLDAVRLYLSDLPDWDVEDLMADIEQHVIEVASEWDGPITSVLGDPVSFVEEYRQSADVPPVQAGPSTPPLLDRLVRAVENLRKGHLWLSVRAFAQEARPGWWALRGYMAASIVMVVASSTSRSTMVDPFVFGPKGLILTALGVLLSVHLGRRSQTRSWRRWGAIVANLVVVSGIIVTGQQVNNAPSEIYADVPVAVAVNSIEDAAYRAGFADGRDDALTSVTTVPTAEEDQFEAGDPDPTEAVESIGVEG